MNNAIVCLTRGYKDLQQYKSIIKRNKCIARTVNVDRKYPLIIFHEGNIDFDHQAHIRHHSENQDIRFVDISSCWVGGYESMCRFHAYWIWEFCADFDNILRVDEDCWIEEIKSDPFEQMGENVYLKTVYWDESHSETNATLPDKVEHLTGISRDIFYNRKYPYTNISVSSVSFWRQDVVADILREISLCDDQIKNRWGDLPILGSLLNIYAVGKVGTLEGLNYYHHSHDMTIESK